MTNETVTTLMSRDRPLVDFGEIAVCPKCGGEDLWRQYHENTHVPGCDLFEFEPKCCKFEHHCRGCRGCHFEWAERPMQPLSTGERA